MTDHFLSKMKSINNYLISLLLLTLLLSDTSAQNFTQPEWFNPNEVNLEVYWTGAAWLDVNNDDKLDLILTNRKPIQQPTKNRVLINTGKELVPDESHDLAQALGFWFGVNLVDYNNDGHTDVYISGVPSALYKNNGDGTFDRINEGDIAKLTSSGIASAWGDFNMDGFTDLLLVRPQWIPLPPSFGPPPPPQIFINSGSPDYQLNLIDTNYLPGDETFLQPTLHDIDQDGDLDIAIGMGSGKPKKDWILMNQWKEKSKVEFIRDTTMRISTRLVEGNHWSFEDIDNDGDFDAFLTNWATSKNGTNVPSKNVLYRFQDGEFVDVEDDIIVNTATMSSTATWGDFDNDADLDLIEVNDSTYNLKYYQNDGFGNFKSMDVGALTRTVEHQSGIAVADYDDDGDLDIFVPGASKDCSFLENSLDNGNKWIQFKLIGNQSNKSAIGALLRLSTTQNDSITHQLRVVSGSSTFMGSNTLIQHFGIAKQELKELTIEWPSGKMEKFTDIESNSMNVIEEGKGRE